MKNESCLRHRAVKCVYNEENCVNHLEYSLNLTTEVCVAGSVNDVDADALVIDCCILCEDSNSSFTLQVIGVHYLFYDSLVLTVYACLLEH